jgi:SAM-dependent methyltransferase
MRILLTRYGGIGDLIYIEPVIRAIKEKYNPTEIIFRTHKDYNCGEVTVQPKEVLKENPFISAIVFDDKYYGLGIETYGLCVENLIPKNLEKWGSVNPYFDMHINFQTEIEKNIDNPNLHAIDVFANAANVKVKDRIPKIYYDQKIVPKYELVVQLKSAEEDRDLSKNNDLIEMISKSNLTKIFLGEQSLNYHEFVSIIANCEIFIGTESCGTLIATGLNKKVITIFKNEIRIKNRSYENAMNITQDEIVKFKSEILNYITKDEKMDETSKCLESRKKAGYFDLYLKGKGIDIGCGKDKLIVEQGSVDAWDLSNGDAMLMKGIANETYDFVYSSHCLEHLKDVEISLFNWSRILKKNGYLYFVIPEYVLYERMTFPSLFNKDHKQTFSYYITKEQVKRNNHYHYTDIIKIIEDLNMEVEISKLEDDNYDYSKGTAGDQTFLDNALSQILFVAKKKEKTPVSQMGADDWVLSHYKKGYFVDAGCCDGEDISNTYKLEKLGWNGLCIDVIPKNFHRRPKSKVVEAALHGIKDLEFEFTISKSPEISGITDYLGKQGTAAYTGWKPYVDKTIKVKTQLLHEILDANNAPNFIEYLNIDIEGVELEVLKTFPFEKYKFGCISLEHNYDEPKRTHIKNLLKNKGYNYIKQEKADDWFVLNENNTKVKTIGLCMIVKNESKIIERCLDSVKPMIDYVSIVDTGSTDDTIKIINSWLDKNNISGQVISEPWKNFAYNRSFALAKLREQKDIDYALMIDADEVLRYEDGIDIAKEKQNMTHDLYNINCKFGNIEYARTSITKNNMPYCYKGVVHEFLECHDPIKNREMFKGVYNVPLQDSARNESNQKFQNDIKLLEDELKIETDKFMISRYTFYLAQSYRDCEEKEKAIYWYNERAKQGFWNQEVYISLCQVAKLKEQLEYPGDDIVQSYMRAYEACPERIEALHGAINYCRRNGRNHQAFMMATYARSIPVNKTGLFSENWIWNYGIDDEYSIISYWTGHIKEGIAVTENLLNKIPESQKPRVLKNMEYLKGKLIN